MKYSTENILLSVPEVGSSSGAARMTLNGLGPDRTVKRELPGVRRTPLVMRTALFCLTSYSDLDIDCHPSYLATFNLSLCVSENYRDNRHDTEL